MLQGGNAIDAAIATLLCNGLLTMQSMGIGGGTILNYYSSKRKQALSIIGRERAASRINLTALGSMENAIKLSQSPLAIGVPGEVAAYHAAHHRFGNLPWSKLVKPTIELCRMGYNLTRHQYDSLYLNEARIYKDKLLKTIFVNPETKLFHNVGQHIKLPQCLCKTYQMLADEGPTSFYNGSLADLLSKDLHELQSSIDRRDLEMYKPLIRKAIKVNLAEYTIHLVPPPGSGHVIAFIVNILKKFEKDFSNASNFTALEIHRIIEALKFGFVKRWESDADWDENILNNITSIKYALKFQQLINDLQTFESIEYYGANSDTLVQADYGTAHISLIDPNGDAVSATSSINYYFGSGRMGSLTGIIFNNAISDFTIDRMQNYFDLPNVIDRNNIRAFKQPMSSMSPLIVSDRRTGSIRLVAGAAGGTRIISTLTQILIRVLCLKQNIKEAIDAPRFHHQLLPPKLQYEFGILQQDIDELERKGHRTERIRGITTVVCGLERPLDADVILANADYRKEGAVDGF